MCREGLFSQASKMSGKEAIHCIIDAAMLWPELFVRHSFVTLWIIVFVMVIPSLNLADVGSWMSSISEVSLILLKRQRGNVVLAAFSAAGKHRQLRAHNNAKL